jgi:MFS family permease
LPRTTTLKLAFLAFTVAQLVSIFGDRLHQFSVVGMIGRVAPGSATELFQFALFGHLPVLFLAPLFGTLIDRANRVLVIIVVDVVRGVIVALIPSLYHSMGNLYAFYIPVFFLSLANLLFSPAKSAVIAEHFGPLKLLRINAILWGLGIIGSIGGFVVGGWLLDYRTWELSFYSDAASYLVSVLFLLPLLLLPRGRENPPPAPPVPETDAVSKRRPAGILGLAGSFRDAVTLIRADRRIAYGLIAQTSLLGTFGVLYVVGIARIQEVLPADRTIYLSAVATSGTVGLLAGSLAATVLHGRMTFNRVVSVSTVILGMTLAGVSQARSVAPFMAWAFVSGLAFSPIIIVTETLLQVHTPDAFRGRVFAAREATTKTSFLVMSFLATLSTAVVDKALVVLGTGVVLAVVGMWLERKNCLRV